MNTQYIIILFLILIILYFYLLNKKSEHLTETEIESDIINNIVKIYRDASGTATFTNLNTTGDINSQSNIISRGYVKSNNMYVKNNLDVSNNITAKTVIVDNLIAKNFMNKKKIVITYALDVGYHGPIYDLSGNRYKLSDWVAIPLTRATGGYGNGGVYDYTINQIYTVKAAITGTTLSSCEPTSTITSTSDYGRIIMNTDRGEWWTNNYSTKYQAISVLMIPTSDLDMNLSSYIDTNRSATYTSSSASYTESADSKFIYIQNLKYTDDPSRLKSFDFTTGLLDTRGDIVNPIRGSFTKYNARGIRQN